MINLPKRKSTFNFYESFSDLVFCALVMFLVLVLFLAMNVNRKQELVESDQQSVTQTKVKIEEESALLEEKLAERERLRKQAELELKDVQARIEAERAKVIADALAKIAKQREAIEKEAEARRLMLQVMERELKRQQRIYEQALGTNRFTGLPAKPRLVVAYDWQPTRISVHPVPAWFVDELNTVPPGLAGQPLADHYTALRKQFKELAKQADPLTPRQYRALVRSVSVGLEPVPRVGSDRRVSMDLEFVIDESGRATTQVAVAIPGGNGAAAGIRPGDTLIAIDDQPVTADNLIARLSRYKPGDTARLLVRRAGKPNAIALNFREVRVVEVIQAYRTDLSMVISGAFDVDYTPLWEKAMADALRSRLQQGLAGDVVWQGESRWQGRQATQGRPVLRFDAEPGGKAVLIADQRFSLPQFRRVLEALGGGGIVVEYEPRKGPEDMPKTIYEKVLRPTGFIIRAPQLEKLLESVE